MRAAATAAEPRDRPFAEFEAAIADFRELDGGGGAAAFAWAAPRVGAFLAGVAPLVARAAAPAPLPFEAATADFGWEFDAAVRPALCLALLAITSRSSRGIDCRITRARDARALDPRASRPRADLRGSRASDHHDPLGRVSRLSPEALEEDVALQRTVATTFEAATADFVLGRSRDSGLRLGPRGPSIADGDAMAPLVGRRSCALDQPKLLSRSSFDFAQEGVLFGRISKRPCSVELLHHGGVFALQV